MLFKSVLSVALAFVATANADIYTDMYYANKALLPNLTETESQFHRDTFNKLMASGASKEYTQQELFLLSVPAVTQESVNRINNMNVGWKADISPRVSNMSLFEAKRLMGTDLSHTTGWDELPKAPAIATSDLPENFTASEKWPECTTISHIRDQAKCGSCWAFSSTESFNDRLCIANLKAGLEPFTQLLSTQHTAACCNFLNCFSFGCNGGQPPRAWNWFVTNGVVSGGDFETEDSGETCQPYEVPPRDRENEDPADNDMPNLVCKSTCSSKKYPVPFNQDIHKAKNSYHIGGIENIKSQLFNNGPVSGAFMVYDDFMAYKDGVYSPLPGGKRLGGHAVKVVGWGRENGEDYWLIANSWTESWGDNGYAKIKMGVVNIDDMMVAGDVAPQAPKTSRVVTH